MDWSPSVKWKGVSGAVLSVSCTYSCRGAYSSIKSTLPFTVNDFRPNTHAAEV